MNVIWQLLERHPCLMLIICNAMVEQAKKYLNENFSNGDWYYKVSNKGKHVFWKRQLLLRQRQNQMQIPFNQAA